MKELYQKIEAALDAYQEYVSSDCHEVALNFSHKMLDLDDCFKASRPASGIAMVQEGLGRLGSDKHILRHICNKRRFVGYRDVSMSDPFEDTATLTVEFVIE